MAIDPKHIVTLSGREYPLYAGILAEAHERGLQAIETELIQIPTTDNEHTAIVKATVRMKDGSTFADYGDATPRNTNARIATALIRMSSTRAKGRALRDAINVGQTMLEELPDLDEEGAHTSPRTHDNKGFPRPGNGHSEIPKTIGTSGFEDTWENPKGRTVARKDLVAAMSKRMLQAAQLGIPYSGEEPCRMTNADLYEVGRVLTAAIQDARTNKAQGVQ